MRRFGIALVVVSVLLSLALPAFANESVPEFRDTFAQQSFSGNDGSLDFNDPWVEVGESNGPTSGFVWVWNHEYCEGAFCLKMGGSSDDAEGHGVYRAVDLGGTTGAKLMFDDGRQLLDDDSEGSGEVQISPDGGDTWKTLDTIDLDEDDGGVSFHEKYSIDDFATPNTVIRFKITDADDLDAYWLIDNVIIEATFEVPPTTTTTKPPETTTTTTTTHPSDKEKKRSPEIPVAPEETTTTTSPRVSTPTSPRGTTTTTSAPAILGSGLPPATREAMMSKTGLAIPSASGSTAVPASMAINASSEGHRSEPVETFAAAFFTESGNYGGNLFPSIALGIVIAVVTLIGIETRREN